jgi:hypothetical protein
VVIVFPYEQQPNITAPAYTDNLSRTIGALQQLQVLMASWQNPTLADVARLVLHMQQDFGSSEPLENVIQSLVGQHLLCQLSARSRGATLSARQEVVV